MCPRLASQPWHAVWLHSNHKIQRDMPSFCGPCACGRENPRRHILSQDVITPLSGLCFCGMSDAVNTPHAPHHKIECQPGHELLRPRYATHYITEEQGKKIYISQQAALSWSCCTQICNLSLYVQPILQSASHVGLSV